MLPATRDALESCSPVPYGAAVARSPSAWGERRRLARARIHAHVVHPIDTPRLLDDPLARPSSRLVSAVTSVRLLFAAAAVHGLILLLFLISSQLLGGRARYRAPERVAVQIVETPPPPVVPPEELAPPPSFTPPDFAPEPPARAPAQLLQAAAATPPAVPTPADAAPEVAPRRIVGLNLESTVRADGPAFAVGTTRMGRSDAQATDPDLARRGPAAQLGPASSPTREAALGEQRAASLIPTRDAVFVKPKRVVPVKPPYPATLKAQGVEGDVHVRVDIDASGHVTQVTLLQSSGHAAFDAAALRAARAERFSPATRDGQAVPYALSYSYRFRIEDY